jgi:hypothetical protein
VANFSLVLGVHIGFIVIVVQAEGRGERVGASLGLAIFRLAWDMGVLPGVMRLWQEKYPHSFFSNSIVYRTQLMTYATLIDSIAIPVFASIFSDEKCLLGLVSDPDSFLRSEDYSLSLCHQVDIDTGSCIDESTYGTGMSPSLLIAAHHYSQPSQPSYPSRLQCPKSTSQASHT